MTLRRQELHVSIDPQLLVHGQPLLLQRLFRNLIDNAMRYTPAEGRLTVSARRRGDQALVSVLDTGIGLSREQMSRVFDRFWRASSDRSDGGTGLGLAIASQICQAHGGRILVTSQPGQGSCFEVVLPLLQGV
jgi:signal transduction histidine kinase